MKILVGIDVQPISEVQESLTTYGTRYTRRLFTDHELSTCGQSPGSSAPRLAGRFAAKEAVLKILDVKDIVPSWKEIEVRRTETGRPEIALSGIAARIARRRGIRQMSLSLSHAGDAASAVVVARVSPYRFGVAR
jgi:holo-[acyl-carrier protein] synthase